jgi:four helix bundle protein
MGNHRALEAAELVEDRINELLDNRPQRLIHADQLRSNSHSIVANISEGVGRDKPGERSRAYRVARGEAEETIKHLRANARTGRLDAKTYLSLRSTLITISKMLDRLVDN